MKIMGLQTGFTRDYESIDGLLKVGTCKLVVGDVEESVEEKNNLKHMTAEMCIPSAEPVRCS